MHTIYTNCPKVHKSSETSSLDWYMKVSRLQLNETTVSKDLHSLNCTISTPTPKHRSFTCNFRINVHESMFLLRWGPSLTPANWSLMQLALRSLSHPHTPS